MIKIALVDDHKLIRQAIRTLLENTARIEIVAEADNGLNIEAVLEKTQPDILIMDLMMPGLNGLETLRRVNHQFPRIHLVVLSMHNDETYLMQAITYGAEGYVLKESSASDLLAAIDTVIQGKHYLSPSL